MAMVWQSGDMRIPLCSKGGSSIRCTSLILDRSHVRIVLSLPPETSVLPSALKTKELTHPVWPSRRPHFFLVPRSQSSILGSLTPVVAKNRPSGERAHEPRPAGDTLSSSFVEATSQIEIPELLEEAMIRPSEDAMHR